jgi:hypothetical protein
LRSSVFSPANGAGVGRGFGSPNAQPYGEQRLVKYPRRYRLLCVPRVVVTRTPLLAVAEATVDQLTPSDDVCTEYADAHAASHKMDTPQRL